MILSNPCVRPTSAGAGLAALRVRTAGPLTHLFSRTGKKPYLAWWEEAFPGELARDSGAVQGKLRVGSENWMLRLPRWRGRDGTDNSPSPGCLGPPLTLSPPPPCNAGGTHHSQRFTRSTPHLPDRGWRPNKAELAAEAPPRVAHILLPCKAGRRAPPPSSSYPTARSAPGSRTGLHAPNKRLLRTRWEPPTGLNGLE